MHSCCGSLSDSGVHRGVWLSPVFYCEYQELNETPQRILCILMQRLIQPAALWLFVPGELWLYQWTGWSQGHAKGWAFLAQQTGKHSEVLAAVSMHWLLWTAWDDGRGIIGVCVAKLATTFPVCTVCQNPYNLMCFHHGSVCREGPLMLQRSSLRFRQGLQHAKVT